MLAQLVEKSDCEEIPLFRWNPCLRRGGFGSARWSAHGRFRLSAERAPAAQRFRGRCWTCVGEGLSTRPAAELSSLTSG